MLESKRPNHKQDVSSRNRGSFGSYFDGDFIREKCRMCAMFAVKQILRYPLRFNPLGYNL